MSEKQAEIPMPINLEEEVVVTPEASEPETSGPGIAVGIQLFASENKLGVVVLHDAEGNTCAQVSLTADQVDEMGAALYSLGNHLKGVDDVEASIEVIDKEIADEPNDEG
jgi:hypothetical protein